MAEDITFTNNGQTTLDSSYTGGTTTITLASGEGAKFPSPVAPQVAKLTVTQAGVETYWETCLLISRTGDVLTIDGFASNWPAGSKLENRVTASYLNTRAKNGANTDIDSIHGVLVGRCANGDATTTAYGRGALRITSVRAINNTAIGDGAMGYTGTIPGTGNSGSNNVAVGTSALAACQMGQYNVGVGVEAISLALNPTSATVIGYGAGKYGAANSVCVGYQSGISVTGTHNTLVGSSSGQDLEAGAQNVIIGAQSGSSGITSGDNNTIIGAFSTPASQTASNVITLGNSSITTLRCQVTSITALSDARDKTDVGPLRYGVDFLNTLKPVSFTWAMRDGGKAGVKSSGFIAQDLQAAQATAGAAEVLNLVYAENPEKLEATYGNLIPVLVKAIQELSARVKEIEGR